MGLFTVYKRTSTIFRSRALYHTKKKDNKTLYLLFFFSFMKLLRSVVSRKTWIHGLLTTTSSVSFSTFYPSSLFQGTTTTTTKPSLPGSSLVVDAMSTPSSSSSSSNMKNVYKIIDSHLHVWGTEKDTIQYPYQQEPPNQLKEMGSVESLIQFMDTNHVAGALIIQPINYKYDHSYITNAIHQYPNRFKGMMLYNPNQSVSESIQEIQDRVQNHHFVGVRYNPYLWPKTKSSTSNSDNEEEEQNYESMMSMNEGLEIYQYCGKMKIPVGIMCFQGLSLHYHDIVQLLTLSPETIMVLDHFAFTRLSNVDNNNNMNHDKDIHDKNNIAFEQLLSLSKYENVYVKISALFRLQDPSVSYEHIYQQRFVPLLHAFGSNRLMYGSDFPYVLETKDSYSIHQIVTGWITNETDRYNIMCGTAERLFGTWNDTTTTTTTCTTGTESFHLETESS